MISSMSGIMPKLDAALSFGFYIERDDREVDMSAELLPLRNHAACLGSFRGRGACQGAARSAGVSVFWESLLATAPSVLGLTRFAELRVAPSFRFIFSVTNW